MNRSSAIKFFKAIAYIGVYGGLLMPLVFVPYVIFPFVFSKLVAFQVLIGVAFPSYVALAWMEPKYRPPKSVMYGAILAYFVALLMSVAFAVDPVRAWWGNQERMNGLFTLLHFLAWLTMAIGILKTWTDWRRLLNYEAVLAVVMAGVALLQLVNKNLLLFPANERVGGLLDNPIYMGAYQIFNLSFLALLFLKTKSNVARVWYVAAAGICFSAFMAAQSRGALVGLAAAIGTFALYVAVFGKNKKARIAVVAAGVLFFAAYGAAFAYRDSPLIAGNSIMSRLTHFSFSSETRLIAWNIAWQGFVERPLTGWGLDNFHILFNLKYNPKSLEFGPYETWFDRAHNTVMDVLAMTGIFGFITFFAIFGTLFVGVWRARKRGWIDLPTAAILTALPVGYFLQNLFVFDHPAAFSMSYLLYAFVIAATQPGFMGAAAVADASVSAPAPRPANAEKEPERHFAGVSGPHAAPWIAFGVIQIVLLLVVWRWSVLPFKASLLMIRANQVRAADMEESWRLTQEAGRIPTPYADEQTFLLSRDLIAYTGAGTLAQFPRWREMYEHTKKLTEAFNAQHDRNTHSHFIYARLLTEMAPLLPREEQPETLAQAEREYRKAIETSPKRQQLWQSLARLYSIVGAKQESYDALKTALDFNQNVGESWWYAGITNWLDLNNVDRGMEEVLQSVKVKSPYALTRAQDALYIARAAAAKGDKEVLQKILVQIPTFSGGSVAVFLDFAREYERAGLISERNIILNAIEQVDPSVAPKLEALRNGSATSIDASIAAAPPDAAAPAPEAPTSTSANAEDITPNTFVASSSSPPAGAVGGPRAR